MVSRAPSVARVAAPTAEKAAIPMNFLHLKQSKSDWSSTRRVHAATPQQRAPHGGRDAALLPCRHLADDAGAGEQLGQRANTGLREGAMR